MININEELRLREYDGIYNFALSWYQDLQLVRLVDGESAKQYDLNRLKRMYEYLNRQGELYFIEVREKDEWIPIGDVAFWQYDMPIVIGESRYRGKGIGHQVVEALKQRGKLLGYTEIYVDCIYHYNKASQAVFQKSGFTVFKENEKSKGYKCLL